MQYYHYAGGFSITGFLVWSHRRDKNSEGDCTGRDNWFTPKCTQVQSAVNESQEVRQGCSCREEKDDVKEFVCVGAKVQEMGWGSVH